MDLQFLITIFFRSFTANVAAFEVIIDVVLKNDFEFELVFQSEKCIGEPSLLKMELLHNDEG